MAPKMVPFADGPTRPKQVLSLGFFRTGSRSLQAALEILGLRDVFHTSVITPQHLYPKWTMLDVAADDNIPSLATYTGRTWDREAWDRYFGPCEALTDVTPFAEALIDAYPEAKVILVRRNYDAWQQSFLKTLMLPSSEGVLAWLSGKYFQPMLGCYISSCLWKMYMGLFGVSRLDKARDPVIMRVGYERHYRNVRRMVPPEKLLELDLDDLDWKPICEFLGKPIPDEPFPRLNESRVFQDEFKKLHRLTSLAGSMILTLSALGFGVVAWGAAWLAQRYNML